VSIIRADNVTKLFGRKAAEGARRLAAGKDLGDLGLTPAVVEATFEVEPGEIFVVMGLSGSGKSTLIRMLNGLLEPTAGRIEIDGQDIASMSGKSLRALRQDKISMVFQHFALFPHRSVLANAAYGLEVQGVPRRQREEKGREFLKLVGLAGWEDKLPGQLSGGMKQRVGLARALAAGTDVILMDEAFSALDPLIRREVQDLLLDLQSRLGKTVVFITHDLNEAMRIGDRIAVMRDGRIIQIGTAEEILTAPADDYVARFVADVDRTRVLTAASVMEPANAGTPADLADPVPPDTAVADLFGRCAESALPVPVVDGAGTLLGVIPRVTLLAALGAVNDQERSTGEGEVVAAR
jgi:glycine betaine/proline transport system ATP-binding protein